MSSIWTVDAAGGGGQLVRTAVALAALSGRPLRLTGIRAGRSRPGLGRQHVAAVQAVARAVGGALRGDQLGSLALDFEPGTSTGPLDLTVHIGTAGSTTLVLQCLLPLLVRRGGQVRVHGGTDNPLAPPIDYTTAVLLPVLRDIGIEVSATLERRGYYPKGGGAVVAMAPGQIGWPGFERGDWSEPARVGGVAYSSQLPLHVTERLQQATQQAWKRGEVAPTALRPTLRRCPIDVELRPAEPAIAPGAGLVLWCEDAAGRRVGASALGEPGKPAERVAQEAVTALLAEVVAGAPCDAHLGDQLAVWAALADGSSRWRVSAVTEHLACCLQLVAAATGGTAQVDGTTVTFTPPK